MRKLLCRFFLFGAVGLFAACGDDDKNPVAPTADEYPAIVEYLADPAGEPPPVGFIDIAVELVALLHERDGGSTYSLRWGNLSGLGLYAVSLYPDLGTVHAGPDIDKSMLKLFVEGNLALLGDPRATVGTWYNEVDGMTYVDVSAVLEDREEAIALGRRYNQISIWDLKNSVSIATCDTTAADHVCGLPLGDLPPPLSRLPKW